MVIPIYKTGNSLQSNSSEALSLASKSSLGEIKQGKVIYSIYEALYLVELRKAEILDNKLKKISFNHLLKKADHTLYVVFKDLRNKGNIVKEGMKFGADFRVYKPGERPGQAHAKYLLYATNSNNKLNLKDFCAKARIAHTTKKILLLAVVDSEEDVSYYEINWKAN